jgi:hypothetical protein
MNNVGRLGSILLVAMAGVTTAHADTIALWTFETSVPTTAGPFAAEVGSGQALGSHASTSTAYSNPVGNGSQESFSSTNWAVGDYYQFSVSTLGYIDLSLSWDQTSSGTGPRDFRLAYSTNGTTFTDVNTYAVQANAAPNPVWTSGSASPLYSFAVDLSAINGLENQSLAVFRLIDSSTVAVNGGTVASTGTDRVDIFRVSATASTVPLPAAAWLFGSGLLGLAGIGRRRRAATA